jgi:uncharacterized phage protein gp47/JayE
MFVRPKLTKLIAWAQSDIETRLPGAVASLRRTVENALARAIAGAAHGLHGHLVWLSKQLFPDTAEAEYVERWANIWGLTRTPAVAASGDLDITGTPSTVCPDGTEWETADGYTYIQDGDTTIGGGGTATATVVADIASDDAGSDWNQTVGVTLSLVSPVSGIDSTGTVSGSGLTGGVDVESDAALLVRLLARLQTPPSGGGPGDYEAWALEVSGVTRAWEIANGDGPGTVVLYFVMDDKAGTIIPNASEVQAVQDHLDAVAPITADVNVYAPTAVPVSFTILVTPDTVAVRTAVEAELTDYILRNSEADGTSFPLSQLDEAISLATGETDHELVTPWATPTFAVGEIATMGTIAWTP